MFAKHKGNLQLSVLVNYVLSCLKIICMTRTYFGYQGSTSFYLLMPLQELIGRQMLCTSSHQGTYRSIISAANSLAHSPYYREIIQLFSISILTVCGRCPRKSHSSCQSIFRTLELYKGILSVKAQYVFFSNSLQELLHWTAIPGHSSLEETYGSLFQRCNYLAALSSPQRDHTAYHFLHFECESQMSRVLLFILI